MIISHGNWPQTNNAVDDYRSKALIGTSIDGTITQLLVVERGWQLLKYVQNMCTRDVKFCQREKDREQRSTEQLSKNPRLMHINGDILHRLLVHNAETEIARLLDKAGSTPDTDGKATGFMSTNEKWAKFRELSMEVLGERNAEAWDKTMLVMEVVRWITYVMRNAL